MSRRHVTEAPDQLLEHHEAASRNHALKAAVVVFDDAAGISDIVAAVNFSIAVEYLAPASAEQTIGMHHIARLVEGLVVQAADLENFGIRAAPAPEGDQPMLIVDEHDVDILLIDSRAVPAQPDQI